MSFPSEKMLWARFAQSETAVYFATAKKAERYYGFGVADELFSTNFDQVQAWLKTQPYPVFGGVPFDAQTTASPLMNGYFFRPEILYDVTDQVLYGRETNPSVTMSPAKKVEIIDTKDELDWPERVRMAIQVMQDDESKQKVVLGRQRSVGLSGEVDVTKLLSDLSTQQPNSYHFVLKHGDELFVSATPERLIRVKAGKMETAAVAGSIRRGEDTPSDQSLAEELLQDEKNLQEHAYVVDTILSQLADIVDLDAVDGPAILKTPQIQHLYTPIKGRLLAQRTILDAAARLHPTPALGGKPREWALAEIRELEKNPRGLFAAPIGMLKPNGDGELIVGIRSMLINGHATQLFAGAGILAESNPVDEYNETGLKMRAMMALLEAQHD